MLFSYAPWNLILEGLLVFGFIMIAGCVFVTYLFLVLRKGKKNQTLNTPRRKILSFLAKKRDGVRRTEICSCLDLPIEVVAQELSEMEKEGLIKQEWLSEDYLYFITRSR